MTYVIQYWNERDAEWRGTGSGTFYDKAQAVRRMKANAEMTDFTVRFRVEPVA
jgi:hypothetical protein